MSAFHQLYLRLTRCYVLLHDTVVMCCSMTPSLPTSRFVITCAPLPTPTAILPHLQCRVIPAVCQVCVWLAVGPSQLAACGPRESSVVISSGGVSVLDIDEVNCDRVSHPLSCFSSSSCFPHPLQFPNSIRRLPWSISGHDSIVVYTIHMLRI